MSLGYQNLETLAQEKCCVIFGIQFKLVLWHRQENLDCSVTTFCWSREFLNKKMNYLL